MGPDAISALKANQLFAPLAPTELSRLLADHQRLDFDPGRELFQEGAAADRMFLVLSGTVRLTQSPSAKSLPDPILLGPGETAGEEAVLSAMPYCATAEALTPVTAIAIPAASLMGHLEGNFDQVIAMISAMATHLRERVREITELKMQSTSQRLANFLLGLAGQENGAASVRLPCEKRQLADHLGMDPATLSRAFAKLRDQGVSASRGDKVDIEDLARLRAYGDGAAITH